MVNAFVLPDILVADHALGGTIGSEPREELNANQAVGQGELVERGVQHPLEQRVALAPDLGKHIRGLWRRGLFQEGSEGSEGIVKHHFGCPRQLAHLRKHREE